MDDLVPLSREDVRDRFGSFLTPAKQARCLFNSCPPCLPVCMSACALVPFTPHNGNMQSPSAHSPLFRLRWVLTCIIQQTLPSAQAAQPRRELASSIFPRHCRRLRWGSGWRPSAGWASWGRRGCASPPRSGPASTCRPCPPLLDWAACRRVFCTEFGGGSAWPEWRRLD